MNKKVTSIVTVLMVATGLAACGRANAGTPPGTGGGSHEETRTGATVTNDKELFRQNFASTGHWIGATTENLTFEDDFIVEGDFWDKNDEANDYKRKLALYTQDDQYNVKDRFSLTAPRVIVRSPNTVVSKGTIAGDVYVESNGFNLDDAIIDGNVIFSSQEYKDSANLDSGQVKGQVTVE